MTLLSLLEPEWYQQATCRTGDPERFFPVRGAADAAAEAKAICDSPCPVKAECLAYALTFDAKGVWGGTSERDRRKLRAARLGVAS